MARYKTLLFCAPVGTLSGAISGNAYIPVSGSCSLLDFSGAETENWSSCNINTAGTISGLAAKRGGSNSVTDILTLRVNYTNTTLTVATSAAGGFAEDTTHSVGISQGGALGGDVASYDHTNSTDYSYIRALFEPATDNTQVSLFAIRNNGSTLGAWLASSTGTNYLPFCGGGLGLAVINTTESLAQIRVKTAGSFKNVAVHVVYNTAGSAVTFRSRKNGVDGNITFSIPAGSTGRKFDFTNSDDLDVDDLYCFSASAPSSGRVEFVLLTCEYHHTVVNGDHEIFCGNPGRTQTLQISSNDKFIKPVGDLFNGAGEYFIEADAAVTFGMNCGAKKFRLTVTTNTCSAAQFFTIMKNGIATALTFTVGAGLTGEFIDNTNEISLLATDTVSIRQTGGGTGALGVEYFGLVVPAEVEVFETGEDADECGEEDEADPLQTALSWPKCELTPGSINVQVVSPTVSPGRSFTGLEKVIQPDAGHWRIILRDIPIRTRGHTLKWREIESGLDGRNNPVLVPVYESPLSDESIAVESGDGGIGAVSLNIIQTAGGEIEPGMHFSTPNGYLHRIKTIEAVEVEEIELFAITFWPPLREELAGSELEFNDPVCRCRLESDDGMDVNLELLRFASPSVAFVEDV